MAANVETMFYTREKPWHGLGTMVQEAPNSADALRLAGLDWTIEGRGVYTDGGIQIKGYQANTRSSDGAIMGIVTDKYRVVQNAEAFEFTDALIGEGVTYETAGSLRGGKTIWLLARMPETQILGDKFEPYICFTNSHDGTGTVRACMTPVRVVCNNTLNIALNGASRKWSTPHKGDVMGRLDEARQTLGLAQKYMQQLAEDAERLADAKMNNAEIDNVIEAMFPVKEDATERQKKNAEKEKNDFITCLFAPDLAQFYGTQYGFLNAVADYAGHSSPMRRTKFGDENRWGQIITGHPLLDLATQMIR